MKDYNRHVLASISNADARMYSAAFGKAKAALGGTTWMVLWCIHQRGYRAHARVQHGWECVDCGIVTVEFAT